MNRQKKPSMKIDGFCFGTGGDMGLFQEQIQVFQEATWEVGGIILLVEFFNQIQLRLHCKL